MKTLINIFAIALENYFIFEMLCRFKNIKSKKILLYLSLLSSYFLSGFIINFDYSLQTYFYIIYATFSYLFMKIIYKKDTQIIDIFVMNLISIILMSSSLIIITVVTPYEMAFLTYIIALIIILKLKINYNDLYKKYMNLWNRRDDGRIKSLTIRNISLYLINITLFLVNVLLPYIKFQCGE